jgi:hypothetical protein
MAAHALTIARQIACQIQTKPQTAIEYAAGARYAPGFDFGPCMAPNADWYEEYHKAIENRDLAAQSAAMDKIAAETAFLDGYRCLEEAKAAHDAYVRYGRPHWRKRQQNWFSGAAEAHKTARPAAAPKC